MNDLQSSVPRFSLIIPAYNEDLLFAEDVQLLWDLMLLGRKRGRKLSRITSAKAIFSNRKFDRHSDWHWLGQMLRFFYGLLFSKSSLDNFARMYWYGNQRTKPGQKQFCF